MRVRRRRIRDDCSTEDVVGQDDTARLEQPVGLAWFRLGQNDIQIRRVCVLVGIQEDEIKWFRGLQSCQAVSVPVSSIPSEKNIKTSQ